MNAQISQEAISISPSVLEEVVEIVGKEGVISGDEELHVISACRDRSCRLDEEVMALPRLETAHGEHHAIYRSEPELVTKVDELDRVRPRWDGRRHWRRQ